MIDKCKKYQIMSQKDIIYMETEARAYSRKYKIDTIEYSKLQNMINERLKPLYLKYRAHVLPEKMRELYVYDIRSLQIHDKISKKVITLRNKLGFDCTLFPINVKHIEYLYDKAVNSLLDPYQMYRCIKEACDLHNNYMPTVIENIFTKEDYEIKVKNEGTFALLKNKTEIKESRELKKLQTIVLLGQ
jgi:hypothetical protein